MLAGALFDDVLLVVSGNMRRNGASYLTNWRCDEAESYFARPHVTTMVAANFGFPGEGSARGLIAELGAYWLRQANSELIPVADHLTEISAAVASEDVEPNDGSVDIFCYTMF